MLCIRYRYDEAAKKRFKIIEESEWVPEEIPVQGVVIVGLKIEYHEKELQNRIKKGGGVWNREKKLWFLEYDKVLELGLGARIFATTFSNVTSKNAEFAN